MALVLTLTPSTVSAGQTFQAAVTGATPGEVINFTYDAALPQSIAADASGNASATFTGTTTGPVVAVGTTSGAASATLTISAAENCVITVSSTPANPAAGEPVTVTATVACNGTVVEGATVLFATINGSLGVGVTSAAGQASVTTSTLLPGANVVTATVIAANTNCICVGVSATATVNVAAAQSCAITLSSTPANPAAGQPVTVTATVTCNSAPVQGATVLFVTANGPLGIGVTTAAGQASVTTSTLPAGANVVTATVISADTTCTCVGVSATATVNVAAAQSCAITLSSTPTNPAAGQPVTVTATVTCNGAAVQGATVLFSTINGPLGIGVTTAAGQASVTTSTLPAGANVVTATVISANTTCTCVGVSATATVNVTPAQSCAITLSSTPTNPAAGQPVTVTATVTCNSAPVQGATVLFSTINGPLGIGVTTAAGQASVTTSTLPAGANVVTATVISANTTCTCVGVSATATVNVGASTGGFTANPACYRVNFPPLPWSFATATFSASGATPGAVVTFHLDGASGPVVCTAVANASGNASCTATLNIGQVLFASYTATTPSAGGTLSSSSTLGVCLT